MIGKLRGHVEQVRDEHLLLDVHGVGYVVYASARTLEALQGETQPVVLFIDTHVREDHIHLYGFRDEAEQVLFRLLTSVPGVGNKMALAIQSTFPVDDIHGVILAQDATTLTRVPGVGKRMAERIIGELKNKLPGLPSTTPTQPTSGSPDRRPNTGETREQPRNPSQLEDAISALEHLGYSRADAYRAVHSAAADGVASLDELITSGLQRLAG